MIFDTKTISRRLFKKSYRNNKKKFERNKSLKKNGDKESNNYYKKRQQITKKMKKQMIYNRSLQTMTLSVESVIKYLRAKGR